MLAKAKQPGFSSLPFPFQNGSSCYFFLQGVMLDIHVETVCLLQAARAGWSSLVRLFFPLFFKKYKWHFIQADRRRKTGQDPAWHSHKDDQEELALLFVFRAILSQYITFLIVEDELWIDTGTWNWGKVKLRLLDIVDWSIPWAF